MRAKIRDFSGRFVVRVDSKIHRELARVAALKGVSLNQLCANFLNSGLSNTLNSGPFSDLTQALVSVYGPDLIGIAIFGSVARGSATQQSDLDVLLVFASQQEISRALYQKWEDSPFAQGWSDREISIHCVKLPDSYDDLGSLWLEVALDGIILLDSSNALKTAFSKVKLQIAAGHYQRKVSNGHGYWIKSTLHEVKASS